MKKICDADVRHHWDAYISSRSPEARARLVETYLPLVRYLAERMATTLPASVEADDLASMGTFGLLEAIDRFDPSRGVQFKTFCTRRVRGAILDRLRSDDWVPRLVRMRASLVERTLRRLYSELGREPTAPEMASALGLSVAAFERLRQEASPGALLSLGAAAHQGGEPGASLADVLGDKRCADPLAGPQRQDVRAMLLRDLAPRERVVMEAYYWEGLGMRQIAEMLCLTESRVCQIHGAVIARLREQHAPRAEELAGSC